MNGESPIELAIKKHLPAVVECLCRKGANLSISSASAEVPLWLALTEDLDTAQILVQHGVDTDAWSQGPEGCLQTLLHKAIDENLEDIACFLIRAGCDLNTPRKEGPNGKGGEEAHDLMTPLHLCCQWGLEKTVQTLLEHGANINYRVGCSIQFYNEIKQCLKATKLISQNLPGLGCGGQNPIAYCH